jgi:hypothetical protein
LHSANADKSDCKEKSKESFSHASERKQTAGCQSTHFQQAIRFFTKKKQTNHQNPTTPGIAALCRAENLKAVWARALEQGSGLR